jgi:hypothetical protein
LNHVGVVFLDVNYQYELTMTSGNNDGSLQRVPVEGGRVHDFTWSVTFGTLIGLLSVGLIVSFALLLISPAQEAPVGGAIGKSAKVDDAGSDSVTSVGSDGDVVVANDGATMGNSGIRESVVSLAVTDEEVADIDVLVNDCSDRLVAKPGRVAPTRSSVGTSTNKFIAPRLDETEREFLGVKVKGAIALVCDVSGSMSSDFPVLYRELRKTFPKTTPLILVNGCNFGPPNSTAAFPSPYSDDLSISTEFSTIGIAAAPVIGIANDPHVYLADSTTDAIIWAVEELRRSTVMFSNDLQDGGSKMAVDAFRKKREKRQFTLSGRSVNRDAPQCLLNFIVQSGGQFVVDTIDRSREPAVSWEGD